MINRLIGVVFIIVVAMCIVLYLRSHPVSINFPDFSKKSELVKSEVNKVESDGEKADMGYDNVDKENTKLVFMFNEQIEKEIETYNYTPSKSEEFAIMAKNATSETQKKAYEKLSKDFDKPIFDAKYNRDAKANAKKYFNSIVSIESYARHGVTSTRARNQLELNIGFANEVIANKVYTGIFVNGISSPHILFKILLKDGKATQVFTNGVELKNPPDWVQPDIQAIIHQTMSYELLKNGKDYFPKGKNEQQIKEEWEKVGT